MTTSLGTVLIYGATGAQGAAVVQAVLAAGGQARVLLRNIEKNPFGDRVEVVQGELGDFESLKRASQGMDRVSLVLPLNFDRPQVVRFAKNAIDAAKAAGVKLLVLNTSTPLGESLTGVDAIDIKIEIEAYLKASSLPWISIRPTLYNGNLTAPFAAPAIVHQGVFAYPLPSGFKVSWNTWEDVAAYVLEALKRPELSGNVFNVGGPEALTGEEMAQTLSDVLGRKVTFAPVPLADFAAGVNAALGNGVGDQIAALYNWFPRQTPNPLVVDLAPVLPQLPAKPTHFLDWAKAQDWAALAGPTPAGV